MTVHFICRGNIYRSVIAEAYLKSLRLKNVTVLSSGSVADVHRQQNEPARKRVMAFLAEKGIDQYAKDSAEQLIQKRLNDTDITVVVNQIAVDSASQIVQLPKNIIVWDVDDVDEGVNRIETPQDEARIFETTYQKIVSNVRTLVQQYNLGVTH